MTARKVYLNKVKKHNKRPNSGPNGNNHSNGNANGTRRIETFLNHKLFDQISEFTALRGLDNLSSAVETILDDYFKLKEENRQKHDKERFLNLEEQVLNLRNNMAFLQSELEDLKAIKTEIANVKIISSVKEEKVTPNLNLTPLNGSDLAKRFSISRFLIHNKKARTDFSQWSKKKDPDNICWAYNSSTKLFEPEGKKVTALKTKELADRLGVHINYVHAKKRSTDFPTWSRSKDPENYSWEYSGDSKLFFIHEK